MRRNAIRIASAAAMFLGAAAVGFLLSSQLGQSLVRLEAEEQLARLLRGEVMVESARLAIGDGLWLKGKRVDVYPAKQGARAGFASLSAESVTARLDIPNLLIGKLRLRELEIEGLHLRLERFADGSWSLPPLQATLAARPPSEPGDLERKLGILKASETIARTLLTRPLAANRVELHYATLTFIDHAAGLPGDEPLELHLRGIDGRLEHSWLRDEADLSLRAQLTDSLGRRSSIELSGRRRDDQQVTLAVSDLPMAMLGPYLAQAELRSSADGTLSGVVAYRTPSAEHGVFELDWLIRNLDVSFPLRREPLHVESPRLRLQSRIEIHPGRLRLADLELEGLGGAGELTASAVVERPLRDSALARLATSVRGIGLAELRRIVAWLPESDAGPLTQLLTRLESGRIERIQARGGARVSQWRRLARGELGSLPSGSVLMADVADVAVATDGPAALSDLSAHAEWSGDRIALRQLKARWNGVPLPRVDAAVEGVSHLLNGQAGSRELRPGAEALPGLGALWRVLARGREDPADPAAPFPEMQLAVESLDHPALRWPIRDTEMRIAPTPGGVEIETRHGTWAGAPFRAQASWQREPESRWNLQIGVHEPSPSSEALPDSSGRSARDSASRQSGRPARDPLDSLDPLDSSTPWFHGQLHVDSLEVSGIPTSGVDAHFALSGATLNLSHVAAQLTQKGTLRGSLVVDLATSHRLSVDLAAEMSNGNLSQIAPLVGLGRGQWTGQLSFKADLEGWVDPEVPLLAGLSGPIFVLAREGELRREIPMVLALAQATEGFNPFATRDAARYESVEMTLQLDHGRLRTDDLELDGPIRVYAEGFLDVARPNPKIDARVGVFLFRQADRTIGQLPLVSHLISDQGLVGGYYALVGSSSKPEARGLPLNSIATAVPDVVKAPLRALRALGRLLDGQDEAPPARPDPDWPDSLDDWRQTIDSET